MVKLVRILMTLLAGELVVDMTVNTDKFPFHTVWNGQRTTVRLESRHLENGIVYRNLWTEKGNIPYHLSGLKLFKLVSMLAFKGSAQNFYGGISMKLVTPAPRINVLNWILARLGYATLNVDEHNTLRSVMKMLNDKNDLLKQQVASHEDLLTTFSVQHQNLTEEVHQVHGRLDQTQEQLGETKEHLGHTQEQLTNTQEILGQTRDQLSNTRTQLGQTRAQVEKLEAKTDALCAALGIQSVDEFLQSVMPNKSVSTSEIHIEPLIDADDLKNLPRIG